MTTKIAINGLGRIGRAILKLIVDEPSFELVAINDVVEAENLAYLLRFDTVYGRYSKSVTVDGETLMVGGRAVKALSQRDAARLPWKDLDVELVFECTGALTRREDLEKHIHAGARVVLLSAPAKGAEVETVVHGANKASDKLRHHLLRELHDQLHNADRRSHRPAHRVRQGNDDDGTRLYRFAVRGRWAEQALPSRPSGGGQPGASHDGCRPGDDACPARVRGPLRRNRNPGTDSCGIDCGHHVRHVTKNERRRGERHPRRGGGNGTGMLGVLGVSGDPLVSSDIIGDPRASVVDLELTKVVDGDLVKVMSWYDNEWGYANQMVREAVSMITGQRR